MITDGELIPGLYRVTSDDGTSADYQLAGVMHSDTGDSFLYQPGDGAAGTLTGDYRLVLGRVQFIVGDQGDLWYFPTNRIADAEAVSNEQRVQLTYDYLRQAPYAAPSDHPAPMTASQMDALYIVLGLESVPPQGMPVDGSGSPENPPAGVEGASDTSDPKLSAPGDPVESAPEQSSVSGAASVQLESRQLSPLSSAPAGSSPLPSPELPTNDPPLTPEQEAELKAAHEVALAAGEVSPVLETPSPSDAEVTLVLSTPALSGPGDTATAVETLIVNVEDESAQ